MAMGDVETFHAADGTWKNRIEGGPTLLGDFDAKGLAVTVGREEAEERRVHHILRDLDGRIAEPRTDGEGREPLTG